MVGQKRPSTKVIFAASLIGTSIEWYDYYIFGLASALAFGTVFFPEFSPVAGTLAAFGTFAVGFVVRPFAAGVIGHFGDRIGRKSLLVLTLLLTGVSTALIGVLPTYAAIGVAAPLLLVLLRIVQGFGVGGPLVATALQRAGGSMLVALYLTGLSLASLVAAVRLPVRAGAEAEPAVAEPA